LQLTVGLLHKLIDHVFVSVQQADLHPALPASLHLPGHALHERGGLEPERSGDSASFDFS
jgi:hypothetical protein